ncbi:hypothetical protein PG593_04530 [Riemerella anatipestifer]|nr:hypothetical protein [Riemerella anatipestifer]
MMSKYIQKLEKVAFRFFELFTESIGFLQIAASPFMFGLIVGIVIYVYNPNRTSLFIAITITLIGLLIGVVWATKKWKNKGTIWFISRITATPELDQDKKEDKTQNKNSLS